MLRERRPRTPLPTSPLRLFSRNEPSVSSSSAERPSSASQSRDRRPSRPRTRRASSLARARESRLGEGCRLVRVSRCGVILSPHVLLSFSLSLSLSSFPPRIGPVDMFRRSASRSLLPFRKVLTPPGAPGAMAARPMAYARPPPGFPPGMPGLPQGMPPGFPGGLPPGMPPQAG
jgi:hypothetical protein